MKPTKREADVLQCLIHDPTQTNQEIANNLNISPATVKTHLRNLYKKYRVSGKRELIRKHQHLPG